MRLTYIGGPTALIEWRGVRLLTDPTFDPSGTAYESPGYTLRKTTSPALDTRAVGRIDAVLLSHDHHADNLDDAGRALLPAAGTVLTTADGAERLGGNAVGLAPWDEVRLSGLDGGELVVTATPARHGPEGGDRGPVVGFLLAFADDPETVVWFSGDTVWYEELAQVFDTFRATVALLNLGAAKVAVAGDQPLTMSASDAVEAARALPGAKLVGLHFEGWEHLSQSRDDVESALTAAGLGDRVTWPPPGEPIDL